MIELKNSVFKNQHMRDALMKVANHPKFTPKVALRIAKMIDDIFEAEKMVLDKRMTLIKEHAVLDEKGGFVPKEGPDGKPTPGTFTAKDQAKWDEAHKLFEQETFSVKGERITLKEIEGVGLTPLELKSIEPLVIETSLTIM